MLYKIKSHSYKPMVIESVLSAAGTKCSLLKGMNCPKILIENITVKNHPNIFFEN